MIYVRENPNSLVIVHMAVDHRHSSRGAAKSQGLGVLIIEQGKKIAHRIRGVSTISLLYKKDFSIRISVDSSPSPRKPDESPEGLR